MTVITSSNVSKTTESCASENNFSNTTTISLKKAVKLATATGPTTDTALAMWNFTMKGNNEAAEAIRVAEDSHNKFTTDDLLALLRAINSPPSSIFLFDKS